MTLDLDVSAMIERELLEKNSKLKVVINDWLRRGFAAESARPLCELSAPINLEKQHGSTFDRIAGVLKRSALMRTR